MPTLVILGLVVLVLAVGFFAVVNPRPPRALAGALAITAAVVLAVLAFSVTTCHQRTPLPVVVIPPACVLATLVLVRNRWLQALLVAGSLAMILAGMTVREPARPPTPAQQIASQSGCSA